MSGDNTFELVRTIIVERLDVAADIVVPDLRFRDLGADSFELIDIVMAIEEAFPAAGEISDTEIEAIDTIGDLVALVERKATEK